MVESRGRASGKRLWLRFLDWARGRSPGKAERTEDTPALLEALRKGAQLELVTDLLPALVSYVDAGQCYRFLSKTYEGWFGRSRQDLYGRHVAEVLGPEAYETAKPYIEAALAGQRVTYETRIDYRGAGTREISATYIPHLDEGGRAEGFIALVTDVTERNRLNRELVEANRRAADILESINDAFFSLDREWRFTYLNRVFARSIGRRAEDLIGKVLWEEYPGMLGTVYEESYRQAVRDRTPVRFEAPGVISGRWYQVYAYPSDDGLSVFSTDVDEHRKAREEVEQARAEAEEANRMKDQFLATLSHELRTPLNAILGWAQILRAGRLDPEGMARGLDAIERNSRAQAQLIGDLLDISRITSGKLRLEVQPVDLAEVVEGALSTVLPAAEAREISIERFLDPRVGPVPGDPDRLQQVIWNLLSNAVKFTPKGGRVEVHLAVAATGGHAEIRIRDTGQGIAPDLLPHVFELFRQDDGSSTLRQGGLGLGLPIVRELVELQGGTVQAESPGPGLGATFTVRLPLAVSRRLEEAPPPEPSYTPQSSEGSHRPPLAGLRLLAVDDEPDTLEVMAELLSMRGAEVATASSADQALEVLQRFAPDVLVSDISMPGRDGYDLIREVRTDRGPEDLPAVAVTAFAGPEDRKRALAAGFQVHMAKPVDPGELVNVIARLAPRPSLG